MQGRIRFHVDRPPPEVFAFVADLERAPEWVPDLVAVRKTTPGEVRVGTRYVEVVRLGPRTSEVEIEVTELEPGRSFAHRGESGSSHFVGRFALEPDGPNGGGTLVVHEYEVELGGMHRLLAPFTRGWIDRNVEQAIANLKRELGG